MIMPADILASAVSAHGGANLAYSRNAMTGTPIIMVSREAMRELDAKAMEALVYHELVHKKIKMWRLINHHRRYRLER